MNEDSLQFLIPSPGWRSSSSPGKTGSERWRVAGRRWTWWTTTSCVGIHISTRLAFFVAFALCVGLVLERQLIQRVGLLRRML